MKKIICYISILLLSFQPLTAQYEAPVFMYPGDNLQDTIDVYPSETLYILKEGIHRNQRIIPKHGDILIGEPGAIMNGSLVLDNWIQEGVFWTHTIPAAYAATEFLNPFPCEDAYVNGESIESELCRFPQSLFKDDLPLWRVISLAYLDNMQDSTHNGIPVEPFHGDWYFDTDSLKVYLSFDPSPFVLESTIKISTLNYGIFAGAPSQGSVTAEDVLIKGLTVEKYASNFATIGTGPEGWVVENNNVQLNDDGGIGTSGNALVRSNRVNRNGQTALGGNCSGLIENNEVAYNNTKRFNTNWHAVTKWNYSNGLTLRNNYVHDNYGPGLWLDGTNVNIVYEGNLCENNGGPGIFHEISQDAIIRCNSLINNRSRAKPTVGSIDQTQNLYISNGSNVLVEYNYIRNDISGRPIVVVQNLRDTLGLFPGSPVEVINNHIVYSVPPQLNIVSTFSDSAAIAMYGIPNHFFDNNFYHIADNPDNINFGRLNANGIGATGYNWTEYQAAGFEPNSTIDTDIISAPILEACADIPAQMKIKAKLLLSCLIDLDSLEMTLPAIEDRVHFQPFSGVPWNYTKKDVCPKFYDNMIDWVLLEIREASNPNNILQQKAAILLKDGSIVNAYPSLLGAAQPGDLLDGVVIYDLIPNIEYTLSVKTRQHTIAMANQAIILPNTTAYDFTNPAMVTDLSNYENINANLIALSGIPVNITANTTDICLGESVELAATIGSITGSNPSVIFDWNNGLSNEDSLTSSPTQTTTYFVEMTDDFACTTNDSMEITVHPIPDAPAILGEIETVASSEEIYQIDNPNLTSNFEWLINGGTIIDNANNEVTVLWDGLPPFELCAFETTAFNCTGEESCLSIDIVSSTKNLQLAQQIVVYPNPTTNKVFIKTPATINVTQIVVYDKTGRNILESTNNEIEMMVFPKGVYYLQIMTDLGIVFKRIVLL